MASDWKDALNALKNSGDIPVDDTPDTVAEPEKKEVQKTPLHVLIDKKGRKGKTATIIEGFNCTDDELQEIARILKQRLGTGGSAREGEILIQGDRKNEVTDILKSLGYKTKG